MIPSHMQALVLAGDGLDSLSLGTLPVPRPGSGEVLLRMRAASVGLRDWKVASGAYAADECTRPLVLGGEGVGEVVALGEGASGPAPGTRVCPLFVQGWLKGAPPRRLLAGATLGGPLLHGCFGEYMLARADSVLAVPDHLDDTKAALLPFTALTAWRAVAEQGRIGPDDTVMIQGTGGVPLMALAFAKALGARVILSSSNPERLARARELGADATFNYIESPEWHREVLDFSGGEGVDLVLDPGGSATLAQSIRAVRPGGAISVFNALGSADIDLNLPHLLGHGIAVHGVNAGSAASMTAMLRAIDAAPIRPVIESVVSLSDALAAVHNAPRAERFGKPCIKF